MPAHEHAFGKPLAPFEDRLAMCELAAAALGPRARVSDVERALGGRSLTLRTVRRLTELHPEHAFSLVIGSDLLAEVASWYGADELARTVPFIVVGRPGAAPSAAEAAPAITLPDVSSTAVRAALAAGKPAEGLVPRAVLDYIHTKRSIQGIRMSYMSEAEVNARSLAEGPAEPTPSVFIMGAGVVGTALAARLVRASVPVIGLHGRQIELSDAARAISGVVASTGDIPDIIRESDVVIISVRDERVPEVAERLAREKRLRPESDRAAHVGREPGARRSWPRRCRTSARSGRCTRWCRSRIRASPSRR